MKKIITVGSAIMLLSTSAFASKSRLQALGEDKDGSYFISDFRNIYINPAELNSMGNKVVLEWGGNGTTYQGASLDTDGKAKTQGGVVYGLSNGMKLGVVLGDESDVAALTRMLSSNRYNTTVASAQFMQTADNVIDVFLAGKASVDWGLNLLYSASKNEVSSGAGTANKHKQHAYALRAGASQGAWNAHLLLALGAEGDGPDLTIAPKYKGKLGVRVGGGYDVSADGKAFAMYERYAWDQSNSFDAKRTGSFYKAFMGYGHTLKASESSKVYAKAMAEIVNINLEKVGAMAEANIDRFAIPLTVGFEHQSTDWLVIRGSVVQNLIGTVEDKGLQENFGDYTLGSTDTGKVIRALANQKYGSSSSGKGGKKSIASSTVVNAGMGLKFGAVEIDGNIGATTFNRADPSPSSSVGSNTNKGTLAFDNLETRVGMTYNF